MEGKNIKDSVIKLRCGRCGSLAAHYNNNLKCDRNTEYECSNINCLNVATLYQHVFQKNTQYIVPLCRICSRIDVTYYIDDGVKIVSAARCRKISLKLKKTQTKYYRKILKQQQIRLEKTLLDLKEILRN